MAQESRNAMPQLTVASEPAEPQTTSELISTASPSGGDKKPKQKKNSLEEVEKMRREIRQLQEKRAAAMMNEVVELQRERDTAIARVKILKQSLEGKSDSDSLQNLKYSMIACMTVIRDSK